MNAMVSSKKKILFVIPSLVCGGAEKVIVNLINYLDKSRYEILLVLFERKVDYLKDLTPFCRVVFLNKKHRWDFFVLFFKLWKIVADYKPDVILSSLYYANIITVITSLFFKKEFKLILSEHSYPSKYLAKARCGRLKKCLMRFTYKRADKIVTVSKGIENLLEREFNIDPRKMKAIYNPISIKEIREKSKEEVVHPFFRDSKAQVIIGVGRLTEQKRFDRLLKAVSLVMKQEKNVYLLVLGKGELRSELEELASIFNINKCIDFVGFQPNPYAWISRADVFVLSSDWEGLPNVIIEAMACSTPVISTDCLSGPNEIIVNGTNGMLVKRADEKALAESILILLRDKSSRERFSVAGRKRAEDFSIKKILSQYEDLF